MSLLYKEGVGETLAKKVDRLLIKVNKSMFLQHTKLKYSIILFTKKQIRTEQVLLLFDT